MRAACALICLAVAGCSPTYDWRESRPEGSGVMLILPCRPASHARQVMLAGESVELTLVACRAGDATWALAFAELGDPRRVDAALHALRDAAAANIGADAAQVQVRAHQVRGATPQAASARLALTGKLPDGQAVQQQLVVFSKGTRVFQATCVGPQLDTGAVQTFFDGLAAPG